MAYAALQQWGFTSGKLRLQHLFAALQHKNRRSGIGCAVGIARLKIINVAFTAIVD
jgi:hypothetical protein